MPRPKHPTVYTFEPGPSPAARREIWAGIARLLQLANRVVTGPSSTLSADVHRVFTLFVDPRTREGRFHGWPIWAGVGFANLRSVVRYGGLYLRQCRHCTLWYLAQDARQRVCPRRVCQVAATRARVHKARQQERERQRRAAVTLKGT